MDLSLVQSENERSVQGILDALHCGARELGGEAAAGGRTCRLLA